MGGRCDISGAIGYCGDTLWQALVAAVAEGSDAGLSFKAGVLPSQAAAFCVHVEQLAPDVRLRAHAANGMVHGHVPELTRERAAALLEQLRECAAAANGHVVVTRCPLAWKDAAFVWGPPRGDWALMRTVKEKLDPRRLFNPGRFVDGL
jgi:glycolate oxidase FAD binding subunit